MSQDGPYRLCWRDRIVGIVTDIEPTEFPWMGGKLGVETTDPELLAVLNWISQQVTSDEDLEEPPFLEELVEHWSLR